jgi:hypothetical protein
MRRIFVAVLAVTLLLVCPSSKLFAGTPSSIDRPHIIAPRDGTTHLPGIGDFTRTDGGGEDEDTGDADDLAGAKGHMKFTGLSVGDPGSSFEVRMAARIWWMFVFIHMGF